MITSEDNSERPIGSVSMLLRDDSGRQFAIKTRTDGSYATQVPIGSYELMLLADRQLPEGVPAASIDLNHAGADVTVTARFRAGPARKLLTTQSELGRTRRLARAAGLASKIVEIPAPSAAHSRSYHVEFEAPEGLQVEAASLIDPASAQTVDVVTGSRQRVHLHVDNDRRNKEQEGDGPSIVARINIGPRPETIVRSALAAALLSFCLLAAALLSWRTYRGRPGPALALLLVVPGAFSLFIARSVEHPFSTEVLYGTRVLSVMAGFLPLAGGAIIATSRVAYRDKSAGVRYGAPSGVTPMALGALLALKFVVVVVLALSLQRTLSASKAGPYT